MRKRVGMVGRVKRKRRDFALRMEQMPEAETATPIGVRALLTDIRDLFRSIWRGVRIILGAAFVLVVVSVALQFQVSSRNKDIYETKITAQEARQAAQDAKQAVQDAVAQSQNGGGVDVAKLIEGLNAMTRVEQYVCGGPCPVDEGTEGTNN